MFFSAVKGITGAGRIEPIPLGGGTLSAAILPERGRALACPLSSPAVIEAVNVGVLALYSVMHIMHI